MLRLGRATAIANSSNLYHARRVGSLCRRLRHVASALRPIGPMNQGGKKTRSPRVACGRCMSRSCVRTNRLGGGPPRRARMADLTAGTTSLGRLFVYPSADDGANVGRGGPRSTSAPATVRTRSDRTSETQENEPTVTVDLGTVFSGVTASEQSMRAALAEVSRDDALFFCARMDAVVSGFGPRVFPALIVSAELLTSFRCRKWWPPSTASQPAIPRTSIEGGDVERQTRRLVRRRFYLAVSSQPGKQSFGVVERLPVLEEVAPGVCTAQPRRTISYVEVGRDQRGSDLRPPQRDGNRRPLPSPH